MSASVIAAKSLAVALAAFSAVQAADAVVTLPAHDAMLGLLGVEIVSKPLFYVALLGSSGSVFFAQMQLAQEAAPAQATTVSGRMLAAALKMATFAGSVLVFALLAAFLITILLDYLTPGPTIHSSPGWVGASFVVGVLIRFLPKKLIAAAERAIDGTVDAYERVIGGGKP